MNAFLKWELKTSQFTKTPLPREGSPAGKKQFFRVAAKTSSWILIQFGDRPLLELFLTRRKDFAAALARVESSPPGEPSPGLPEVKAVDKKNLLVLVQDLGSVHLDQALKTASEDQKLSYYKQAVDFIAAAQETRLNLPRFSKKNFFEELIFSQEHLTKKLLNRPLAPPFLNKCFLEWSEICDALDRFPHRPAHRDYHSRNMMVSRASAVYIIDFEGGGLFPRCYDLASLLYDPYTGLKDHFKKQVLAYLVQKRACSAHALKTELLTTAAQRLFKAAGSFAAFYNERGQTTHLKFIPPALKSLDDVLKQLKTCPCFLQLTQKLLNKL